LTSEKMSKFIDDWEQRYYEEADEDVPRIRTVLESFAWALAQKIDKGEF